MAEEPAEGVEPEGGEEAAPASGRFTGDPEAVTPGTGGPLKVLLADDDADTRSALAKALATAGHEVAEAGNAEEALGQMDSAPQDIILFPLKSEAIDGTALLKDTKEKHPDTAVLLSPGQASMDEAVEAMQQGATDILEEPIDLQGLVQKVDGIARARQESAGGEGAAEAPADSPEDAGEEGEAGGEPVHSVELPELAVEKSQDPPGNVEMLMDVPVNMTVLLGKTSILISDLLQLGPGAVVELDKRAGEPVELMVNDKLVALGEVVVVNETFGVRVTTVVDPKDRIQSLR